MDNINDNFFDGYYKDVWRTFIPDELTIKEAEFMLPYFNLQAGDRVLDLMCGYGRHAIALARKGMDVTAVDNLAAYVDEVGLVATTEKLVLKAVQANALTYEPEGFYKLAICMGNSLNFFNTKDTTRILANIFAHLEPGGHLLINSWSIAEIALKNFKEKTWSRVGDLKFLTESKYLFSPTRIEAESTIITPDGHTEVKTGIDYIFSMNEIEAMLTGAGFILKEVFSIPGRKKFTIGEPRAYIIAQKP